MGEESCAPVRPTRHDAAKPPSVRVILPSTPLGVRKGLGEINTILRASGYSQEECGTVEIVLAEVLNNVVEHAYSAPGDDLIALQIGPARAGLSFLVEDNGREMPEGGPPIGKLADKHADLLSLPEGGFGWFIIREVAHDVAYRREDGRNRLSFRIAVG
ncbi:MAG: ATP-binding protein [Pseudomonadota bacterium]